MAKIDELRPFIPVSNAVLAVSDTRELADDRSGATLAELIEKAGHKLAARSIVKDDVAQIRATVLGWIADPEIDVVQIKPTPGDRYLLCSDGLFGVVGDDQIAKILSDRKASLDDLCARLIDAANEAGGPDNITALIIQIDAS